MGWCSTHQQERINFLCYWIFSNVEETNIIFKKHYVKALLLKIWERDYIS